jgi:histidinol-phosphatase (PHP family)
VIDLHVHTWRCRHAEGAAEAYVREAAGRGVSTLCFTEHLPMPPSLMERVPGAEGYAMPLDELPAYVQEVRAAAVLGAQIGVEVLLGIEIDAVPEAREHAVALLGAHPFDLVLGSVHFIDGWAFDDPARIADYDRWDLSALWERYFADLVEAARSGLADVMAHADLVKKFCKRPEGPVGHLYAATAGALSEAGVAVEVNTAGLRKPCRELYPGPEFLTELRRAGVPVTIGSDAHAPDQVGLGASDAVEALRGAGYRSVLVYRGRVAEEVGIDEL